MARNQGKGRKCRKKVEWKRRIDSGPGRIADGRLANVDFVKEILYIGSGLSAAGPRGCEAGKR